MSSSSDTIRIALLALLAGVALPLAVQLFLTARSVRRLVEGLEPRLDRTLADLAQVTGQIKQTAGAGAATSAVLAALVPALVAGVRAFRATATPAARDDVPSPPDPQPTTEKSP